MPPGQDKTHIRPYTGKCHVMQIYESKKKKNQIKRPNPVKNKSE